MRIYIVEDDISVISILEDIVERNGLGTVCGDSDGEVADVEQILALDPDLVLIDLLMPEKDGIEVVRELKQAGCGAKFVMLSQVSDKDMIAKAYTAGVEFFIQKPINLIEVRQVVGNVKREIENEQALKAIQQVFVQRQEPTPKQEPARREQRRLKLILSHLGMAGEKGAQDIVQMCMILLEEGQTVSQLGMSALCARLDGTP